MVSRDTLLLACGTPESREILCQDFSLSYNILESANVTQAMMLLVQNQNCIASVILDASEPCDDHYEFLKYVSGNESLSKIPVVVIISKHSSLEEWRAFDLGASDVVIAPFSATTVRRRVENMVDLFRHKCHLEDLVREQETILRRSNQVMVDTMSSLIEHRSVEAGEHVLRIRGFTQILLNEVARCCPEYGLTEETIRIISSASSLHDIGKIAIPDAILNKASPLTPEEKEIMKTHTTIGCQILQQLQGSGNDDYIRYAHNICHYHHERWDGKGYPEGISGDDIPICAQVVGMADVYDALTGKRVYKDPIPHRDSINMILNGKSGVFSPKLLECLKHVSAQFAALNEKYSGGHSPKLDDMSVELPGPKPVAGLDSLHSTQAKYQALLHLIDAAVLECNMDESIFHMVYNPDPNLVALNSTTSFDELWQTFLHDIVVPEEFDSVQELMRNGAADFMEEGLRRKHYLFHARSKIDNSAPLYQMTMLRIDPGNNESHRMMVILNPYSEGGRGFHPADSVDGTLMDTSGNLTGVRHDRWLTLVHASKDLVYLLGRTTEEIEKAYQNKLIKLVHPDDRDMLLQSIEEQLLDGKDVLLEYRLLHADGRYIWVLDKSRLLVKEDGQEYLYGVLIDISRSKAAEEDIHQLLERHEIILSQTQNVIFEVDLATGNAVFSHRWQEIFGYDPLEEGLTQKLDTASHLHPQDIPLVRKMLENLGADCRYQEAEIRIAKADGRYLWCLCRISVQFDRLGVPIRLVGILLNIDQQKRTTQALESRAEIDSLTGLLNKHAGQLRIRDYLQSRPDFRISAMLLVDFNNFSSVNDHYGHMFGDSLLISAAKNLKKQFRSDDIICRIGGDEFMVFMKDLATVDLVQDRLYRMIRMFRKFFRENAPDCEVSCSIGAAICYEECSGYDELFGHADQALYRAKLEKQDSYRIYDLADPVFRNWTIPVPEKDNPIDSDQRPVLTQKNLAKFVFQQLYESRDMDLAIRDILGIVGQQLNVSRVYIFENNDDDTFCKNTFEWCNRGITSEIHNMQHVSYLTDLPGFQKNFNEYGIFYCSRISALPQRLYDILNAQDVKSVLHCAIMDHGRFRGFVGFDECVTNRFWNQQQVEMLQIFSEIVSVFLTKQRAQDRLYKMLWTEGPGNPV